jgi:hypothetical protein
VSEKKKPTFKWSLVARPQKWRRMDARNGRQKWTSKMYIENGRQKWASKMYMKNNRQKWSFLRPINEHHF